MIESQLAADVSLFKVADELVRLYAPNYALVSYSDPERNDSIKMCVTDSAPKKNLGGFCKGPRIVILLGQNKL